MVHFKIATILIIVFLAGIFSLNKNFSIAQNNNNQPREIAQLLNNIEIDTAKSYKNMVIYPIKLTGKTGRSYHVLDEAIKNGIIEIKEKGSGDVNNLEINKNKSEKPAFLMSGEIVKGAKQDRVIARDIVLAKDSKKYVIPVYCVEQGRWDKQTERFDTAGIVASQSLRSTVVQKKSQSKVWSEVTRKNQNLGASSGTSNYRASYESSKFKGEANSYISHYIDLPDKNITYIGVIVEIDGKISNMDLFSNHSNFSKLWPKLIKAYAQDAVDPSFSKTLPEIGSTSSLIKKLGYAEYKEDANPGAGNEYLIIASNITGNALTYENETVHIATFITSSRSIDGEKDPQHQQIPDLIRRRN